MVISPWLGVWRVHPRISFPHSELWLSIFAMTRGVNWVPLIMSPDTNHCLIDNHLTRRIPLQFPRHQKTKRASGTGSVLLIFRMMISVTWELVKTWVRSIHEDTYSCIASTWPAPVCPCVASSVSAHRQLSEWWELGTRGDQGGPGPLEYAGFTKMIGDQKRNILILRCRPQIKIQKLFILSLHSHPSLIRQVNPKFDVNS